MKDQIKNALRAVGFKIAAKNSIDVITLNLYDKYKEFTMVDKKTYVENLRLVSRFKGVNGCIVECGVWRGGMSAGIAEVMPDRKVFLFDSFEGLPPAQEIDGNDAMEWQKNKEGAYYFDNCKAEMHFAERAMNMAKADATFFKGWFNETLPVAHLDQEIAVLRIDADWYESTWDCLNFLYPKIVKGGLIILDDYYTWDGCSKAVHDYLSKNTLSSRIHKTSKGVAYIIKK